MAQLALSEGSLMVHCHCTLSLYTVTVHCPCTLSMLSLSTLPRDGPAGLLGHGALRKSVASPWVPCVPGGGCPGGVSGGGAWRSLDCPDVFAAEEGRDVVDIVPGKAMALDVVTAGGTLTVINVHGPGSGGDSWASTASFWADVAMYAVAKSTGGTKAVLLGGDFNVWLESPGHPTTKRFHTPWEQCGFHRAGAAAEEDRQPTRAGHRLDSFLLNSPLVPLAVCERPHLAPVRSPASLGSHHGPVVLDIRLAVAGKETVTRMAYSHAQGRLHAIRPDYPRVREAAAALLRKACEDRTLRAWLSWDLDTATMGTSEVQAIFDLLYAFRDDVSRVTGVRMPSGMDPQYPYGQAETEASLA